MAMGNYSGKINSNKMAATSTDMRSLLKDQFLKSESVNNYLDADAQPPRSSKMATIVPRIPKVQSLHKYRNDDSKQEDYTSETRKLGDSSQRSHRSTNVSRAAGRQIRLDQPKSQQRSKDHILHQIPQVDVFGN